LKIDIGAHAASATLAAPVRWRFVTALAAAALISWAVIIPLALTGNLALIHHHELFRDGNPGAQGVLAFILGWQVMVVAMMVPASLPLVAAIGEGRWRQAPGNGRRAAFVAGYLAVWTAFGVLALLGDAQVHALARSSAWFFAHGGLVTAALFLGIGGHQLLAPVAWCERLDASAAARTSERRWLSLVRAGFDHGLSGICGCWSLMLLMFTAGVGNVAWMLALTPLIAYERWGKERVLVSRAAGVAALVYGTALLLPFVPATGLAGL
jgi:predicted metal-binding membrane protein